MKKKKVEKYEKRVVSMTLETYFQLALSKIYRVRETDLVGWESDINTQSNAALTE